ncbi:hypothetical protein [Sinomonas sp.]|uniref:hypothetical protein n=1 Tax=Sinomonas sp. TaxID=1914986 RepID=UPI003F7D8E74
MATSLPTELPEVPPAGVELPAGLTWSNAANALLAATHNGGPLAEIPNAPRWI